MKNNKLTSPNIVRDAEIYVKYLEGSTHMEIASRVNLSRERIRQIIGRQAKITYKCIAERMNPNPIENESNR